MCSYMRWQWKLNKLEEIDREWPKSIFISIKWTIFYLPAFPKCLVHPPVSSLRPVGIPCRHLCHHLRLRPSSCPDRPRRLCNLSTCETSAMCRRPPWSAANDKRPRAAVRSNSDSDPIVSDFRHRWRPFSFVLRSVQRYVVACLSQVTIHYSARK